MYHRAIGLIGSVLLLAGPAMGQDAKPTSWKGFCQIDQQGVKPCSISDRVSPDGQHHLQFSFGGKAAAFLGKNNGPWWSGELNGQPSMGHEPWRGHTIFSTLDLKTTFEWCDKKSADGSC